MIKAIVFDAYGTLFDVAGAARLAADAPGGEALRPVWPKLAEDWRRKQLEYTWLRAITGEYADFAQVTADGLDWAMAAQGLTDADLRARLLALYDVLPAYAEVPGVLKTLAARGLPLAILSNGTAAMLDAATRSAGVADHFAVILSVDAIGIYKPDARVYDLVGAWLATRPDQVLFVSSNGWDVAGAAGYGFHTLWVNRLGLPVDRLSHRPDHIANDLSAIPKLLETL